MNNIYFITGIDTDAGKSYVTGYIARRLMEEGKTVITQKFIQTGNIEFSEDIERHRAIMGTEMFPEDLDHTTAPLIFSYPASAQLAAKIDGKDIDLSIVDRASSTLSSRYDIVLLEGAGGLMVPVTDTFLTIDYIATRRLPAILVTNGILGSINHTILSLEALASRSIPVAAVAYNTYYDTDATIAEDTRSFISRYLHRNHPETIMFDVPKC
ncbi:MAG: dethiobiotin synthase [Duncaniella sp.]|nr:dethiobiotin synthase [Duncaniella sp.]